jgi:hypothetical protein
VNTTSRGFAQSMGYWLNEPAILDHARIAAAMADLGASGYGIVRIMLRQCCFHHRSPEVVAAVAAAVAHGHRHGLRVVYDCEPHRHVAEQLGVACPQALGWRVFRGTGTLRDGELLVDVQLPTRMGFTFDHVVCAQVERGAGPEPIDPGPYRIDWETYTSPLGVADRRQEYVEGRNLRNYRHLRLRSRPPAGGGDGRITLYVAVLDRELVDFAHPGTRAWFRDLIADFRHIPLDGICWDEPATGGDWVSYRYGRGLAEAFAAREGRALAPLFPLLDQPGLGAEAVRARLAYYRLLNETLAEAQADLVAAARAAFGPDLLLGTHHTWQGEGGINDYRAGAVDYFRLTDAMDAGYTDCCWWDPASVAYSYTLGSALARLTPSGEHECNTWGYQPNRRATRWNARLMSLMHVTWFNIWYGDDCDTAMFPQHHAWEEQVASMRRHQRWQRLLGAARPVVEVAVLHDWAGVCGANLRHAANLHKAFCINLSRRALERSVGFDFIDARLLAAAAVGDGRLDTAIGSYRVLVVPGAPVLARAAWERLAAFAAAGGRVLFAGPPPSVDEDGRDLTAAFAALLGMAPLHADDYDRWFRENGVPLPAIRPERFDLAHPLAASPRGIPSGEGDLHGLRSPDGTAAWFSGYEASEAVLAEIRRLAPPAVACHSATMLWRLYRDRDRSLVMLVAREDEELSGVVRIAGRTLELTGGTSACLELPDGGEPRVHVEEEAPARWSVV